MTTTEWKAPWWRVAAYAVAGAVLLGLGAAGALFGDSAGRLLVLVVGVGTLLLGVRDGILRPTLRADGDGVTVLAGLRPERLWWPQVRSVRAAATNRRGLVHLRTLELDLVDGRLVVLSRRQLAADPKRVADALEELRLRSDWPR